MISIPFNLILFHYVLKWINVMRVYDSQKCVWMKKRAYKRSHSEIHEKNFFITLVVKHFDSMNERIVKDRFMCNISFDKTHSMEIFFDKQHICIHQLLKIIKCVHQFFNASSESICIKSIDNFSFLNKYCWYIWVRHTSCIIKNAFLHLLFYIERRI